MADNDLIRRGDALALCDQYPYVEGVEMAIRALPAAQVTVKPLKWVVRQDKYDGGREHYGTGAFGHWYCVRRLKNGVWDIVHHVDGKAVHLETCPTLEAAKAAAQADYEARIRSALTVTPHDLAKVQALVEALEYALRVAEHLCSDRFQPVEDVHMMVLSDAKIASLSDARAALAAWKEG